MIRYLVEQTVKGFVLPFEKAGNVAQRRSVGKFIRV